MIRAPTRVILRYLSAFATWTMTKLDQDKAFEALLTGNLGRVNDFLKFAETKNAALVTFSSAWIVATFNLMASERFTARACKIEFAFAVVFFALACVVCALSFLPQLGNADANKDPEKKDSVLFFDKIAAMDVSIFCATLRADYTSTTTDLFSKRYLSDLMHQMHSNSRIARRKFWLFSVGAGLAGLGVLCVAFPVMTTALTATGK